mmetsp:Transcript_53891/g.172785  ORF Transcript_53891/g.172785 Transcript_53891/m.172785 type:complete len:262 (+) Transcript_53891:1659-2444(+)
MHVSSSIWMSEMTLPLTTVSTRSPRFPCLIRPGRVLRISFPCSLMRSRKCCSISSWESGFRLSKCSTRGGMCSPHGTNACTPPSSDRTKTTPRWPSFPSHSAKARELAWRVPACLPLDFNNWNLSEAYLRCPAAPMMFPLKETTIAPSFGFPSSLAKRSAAWGKSSTKVSSSPCCHLSEVPCRVKASSRRRNVVRCSCKFLATLWKQCVRWPSSKWWKRTVFHNCPSMTATMTPPTPLARTSAIAVRVRRASVASGTSLGT